MLPDGWIAAGLTNAVLPGSAVRTMIHDSDIVIWRGQDGISRAWENRCPHRGMRLSYGMVRGNRLTCLYHGWSYKGDGGCAAIPAHPGLQPPRTIRTRTYTCLEAAGMIWVSGLEDTDASTIPDGSWTPCRSLHLATRNPEISLLEKAVGNGVDFNRGWSIVHLDELKPAVLLAVQPMGSHGAMLHVSVDGKTGSEQLQAVSRWIRNRREIIEPALTA